MWLIAGWSTSWLSPSCQARKMSGGQASGTALLGFSLEWASPGGTEVTACMPVVALVVSESLRPHGLQPARLACPWDSPGKNTAVGCHALLQGIFLTQGSNPHLLCLLRGRVGSYHECHLGSRRYLLAARPHPATRSDFSRFSSAQSQKEAVLGLIWVSCLERKQTASCGWGWRRGPGWAASG